MTNGVFKPLSELAYARATNVMSTESATDFEWSVKIVGTANVHVGIASELKDKHLSAICNYDQNAILYCKFREKSEIKIGSKTFYPDLTKYRNGDVIRFRFEPKEKMLFIYLVRN